MQLIGLTGGIASGKSTVSTMLRDLGAQVIDADAVYHALIEPKDGHPSPLALQIAQRFQGVLDPEGKIDRPALGARVFGDPEALKALGHITHPAVALAVSERVAALGAQGVKRVVYDVPLLYERGLHEGMHAVIVVWVPREVQLQRLMNRDRIDRASAARKIASQMSLDEKRDRADYVIDNSQSREETRAQVAVVWRRISAVDNAS